MYLYRQISALLTRNSVETVAEAPPGPKNRLAHSLQTLVVADGKFTADYEPIAAAASKTLQQPSDYLSSKRLYFSLQTSSTVKVTITSPVSGTSVFVVKAATNHPGELTMQGRVTSIAVAAPAGGGTALVKWVMFEVPDLSDADSFRGGVLATGVVS